MQRKKPNVSGLFFPMKRKKQRKTSVYDGPPPDYRARPQKDPDYVPLRFRALFVPPTSQSLIDRVCAAWFPWSRDQYPGLQRLRAWLLGAMRVETANRYRGKRALKLPAFRARIVANHLMAKAEELRDLAEELRAYAAARDATAKTGCVVRKVPLVAPPPSE